MRRHSHTNSTRRFLLTGLSLVVVCGTVGASLAGTRLAAETTTDLINPTTTMYEKSSSRSFSVNPTTSYICNICIERVSTKNPALTECVPTDTFVGCSDPLCTRPGTSCMIVGQTAHAPVTDFQYNESNTGGGTTGGSGREGAWNEDVQSSRARSSSSSWSLWFDTTMPSSRSSAHIWSNTQNPESTLRESELARSSVRMEHAGLCVMKQSACDPHDTSCLSPANFVQLSCSDIRCTTGNCLPFGNWQEEVQSTRGQSGSRSSPISIPVIQDLSELTKDTSGTTNLGCFRSDGTWTKDRDECSDNQTQYLQTIRPLVNPSSSGPSIANSPEEIDVRRKIEERFFTDEERARQLNELLSPATDAIGRLNLLLSKNVLPAQAAEQVKATVDWLQQIQIAFSNGTQSIDAIRTQADVMRSRLAEIAQMIAAALESQGTPVQTTPSRPDGVLAKMDKIFDVLPAAFSLMQQQNVTVPDSALNGYLDAQRQYDIVKNACMAASSNCNQLSQVISLLEPVISAMRQALQNSGRADLEAQIDALMQQ